MSRAATRVVALIAAAALLALLPLRWFAVPRLVECAFFCYSPLGADDAPPAPVGPDVAPGTFHASTGWGSLPWPVVALVVLAVVGGVAVAARPRTGRVVAVVAAASVVVVALVSFVAQPGLDPMQPFRRSEGVPKAEFDAFVASAGPAPRLTDAMIDVRWPAYVAVAALALLALCAVTAASGSRRPGVPRGETAPEHRPGSGDLDSAA